MKSLRRQWGATSLLTKREGRALHGNRPIFDAFTADDWHVQREFLAARLPDGTAYFQPLLIEKFLTDGGCLAHARDWKSKQRPKFEVVAPIATEPAATAEETAAIFGARNTPRRMLS